MKTIKDLDPKIFKAIPVFVCIGGLIVVEHQFMFLIIGDGLVLRLACLTATTNHASQQQHHHSCLHPKPYIKHIWCNFRISKKNHSSAIIPSSTKNRKILDLSISCDWIHLKDTVI